MANQPQQTPDLFMIPVEADGGLPPKTISKYLKTIHYEEDDWRTTRAAGDDSCVVCLDDLYLKNEATAILECGHEYHIDCIKLWLQNKNLCPLCKAKALPAEEDHDHFRRKIINQLPEPINVVVVQIHDGIEGQGDSNGHRYGQMPDCKLTMAKFVILAITVFVVICVVMRKVLG